MEGSVQAKETQVGWRHVSWGLGIFTVEVVSEKKKTPNIPVTSLSLLYLNPTIRFLATPWKLLALSCHRWAESKSR